MQLVVDAEGMGIRVDLDTENNMDARSLYSAVSRGDISGMSFMFIVDGESWDDVDSEHPTRRIRNIKQVFEVSAVTFPAYSATSIQTRGLADALDSAKHSLESEKARLAEIARKKQIIRILTEVI
jgi:HK97 family phage prohead protease